MTSISQRPKKASFINETSNLISGKTVNVVKKHTGLTNRQALGEIKNQISNRDALNIKPATVTKPNVEPEKTVSMTKKEKTKNGIEHLEISSKETETTAKFETQCKIREEAKSYSSQRFDDLETNIIRNDPQLVPEYIKDIYEYLHSLEEQFSIDSTFLADHRTTIRSRSILVDWLVQVHMNFKFLPETLHLCIWILDRYLQKNKSIGQSKLQLVGITAMLIANKYEEQNVVELDDYVYMCDGAFSPDEVRNMEKSILETLDFCLGRPSSIHFLRRYSRVVNVQPRVHTLAKYFLELYLLEYDLCHVKPSLQAAAALYLALNVLHGGTRGWSKILVHFTTHNFTNIEKTVKLLAKAVVRTETSKYKAIQNKYSSSTYGKISYCPALKGSVIMKFAKE